MGKTKKVFKKILPKRVRRQLFALREEWIALQVFLYDRKRFSAHSLKSLRHATVDQIDGKLTFHAHSLEKGLSHEQLRLGFGMHALEGLAEALKAYQMRGYDKNRRPYINALSVLKEYIDVHNAKGHDIAYVDNLFGDFAKEARKSISTMGGIVEISASSKSNNKNKNFADLFTGRYSVREYADSDVEIEKVNRAINLSMKSPSICNRQSSRVHVITDLELIRKVLNIQGGLSGYDAPPVLLVTTTETGSFLASTERNQIYTDGGLFSMSLLLSLEYEGLAACPLNAMFTVKQDKSIRSLLKLPASENIIMFIGIGNFKDASNVPKSFRFNVHDIVNEIE